MVGTLHVALEEGFVDDEVVVRVDDDEVLSERVRTRMQLGLAETVDVDVDRPACRLTVDVPGRGATTELEVETADDVWVGVSLTAHGGLESRVSATPFGYV